MDEREIISKFFESVGIQGVLLSAEDLEYLKIRQIKKGTKLLRQGEWVTNVYFKFAGGIVRQFSIMENGSEVTECFDNAEVGGLMPDVLTLHPYLCSATVEALCDFPVAEISIKDVQTLIQKYPEIGETIIALFYHPTAFRTELNRVRCEYTAEQKVTWFNNRFPELTGLAREKHIASYLNITPVTLSRIRAKQRKNSTT